MSKCYCISGATGAVGSAIVPLLLERGDKCILIVRAKSKEHLESRKNELLSFWGIPDSDHLEFVIGDLSASRLGEKSSFESIAHQATHFIHSAGNVRLNNPLDVAIEETLNVTRNVLDLFESSKGAQKLEYVSTVGVLGKSDKPLKEDWVNSDRLFHNSYEAAKAKAEDLIKAKVEQGHPISVHRPSMVIGDSKTGAIIHFQVFYYICEFLRAIHVSRVLPDFGKWSLDVIPVDYVAKSIIWSSDQVENSIYHLCSGPSHSIPLEKLRRVIVRMFRESGLAARKPIVVSPWMIVAITQFASLFVNKKIKRQLGSVPHLINYLENPPTFDNDDTVSRLSSSGITVSNPDDYLHLVLKYYIRGKYGKS